MCTVRRSRLGGSLWASQVSVSSHTVLGEDFFVRAVQLVGSYFPEQGSNPRPRQ